MLPEPRIRGPGGPAAARRVLPILPAPARAGSSPGRAQRVQDTRRTAAGALDHRQTIPPPPRSPALFRSLDRRAPARAHIGEIFTGRKSARQAPQPLHNRARPQRGPRTGTAHPIPGRAAGAQDHRPRCRRSTPEPAAGTRCRLDQRAQEGPQRPGGCCRSSRPRPTLEAARTCAARPGRAVRSCRSPGSEAPGPGPDVSKLNTGPAHMGAYPPPRTPVCPARRHYTKKHRAPRQRAQEGPQQPGGCCPSSRPRPALEASRTCAARS